MRLGLVFQPTRPHGARRQSRTTVPTWAREFQPTRPHGARPQSLRTITPMCRFNPRARTGRDTWLAGAGAAGGVFQPTRPHGARRTPVDTFVCDPAFQPTRPHGARHGGARRPRLSQAVSTHAPARGATAFGCFLAGLAGVSTHAPARGATALAAQKPLSALFQPTRPHGARLEKLKSVESAIAVSTHAPARGATRCSRRTTSIFGFQPTRPHGARPCCTAKRLDQLGFQPTRPHGARPATSLPESLAGSGFNPRARTGRDAVFITC